MKRYRMRAGQALIAAGAALGAAQPLGTQQGGAQPTIAIVHATVIDGRGGDPIRDGVVVITDGRIKAVGPFAVTPVPARARVIDGRGKSVLPGLADMHVHLTGGWDGERSDMLGIGRSLNALLYAGVTTVLDVGNVLPFIQQIKQEVAAARMVGPRILMAGPLIDGPRPFWPPLSYAVSSEEQLRTYVTRLKREGVDVIKAYGGLTTEQVATLVATARGESLSVIADVHARNGTLAVAQTGIAAFAHVAARPMTDEAVSYMKAHDVATITTLAVRESFARRRFADSIALRELLREPLLRETMPPGFTQELAAFASRPPNVSDSARAAASARLRTSLANAKRLFDAGLLLVAGTDAPYPGDFYGEGLHRELELLVEAGLTPLQAISAATRNAALLLRQQNEWGTIEPGKRGDVLVVTGDPSRRIRDTRNIALVLQGGRVVDRSSLRVNPRTDPGYHTSGSVAADGQPAPQPAALPIAITHVTVIDVERGERLPDRTVLLQDGRIVAVEPAATVRLPARARVVDGTGKYLIPGLWDMHTHLAREADLARLVAHGVTGTRVMWGDSSVLAWRRRIGRGELLGPTLVTAGRIIEGLPPAALAAVIDTAGRAIVTSADEAVREVRAQKAAGYDFIKVYNNVPRDAYEAIVAEAPRQRMPVAGHVPFAVGLRGVLAAGQTSIEHLRGYPELLVPKDARQQPGADLRSRVLAWRFADTTRVRALARETRDAGVWNTPTLSTRIFTSPLETVERYLGAPEAERLVRGRSRIPWLSNFTADDFRLAEEGNARQDHLLLALRDVGAGLLAGTDIGPWGPSLHRELRFLVAAGLTPAEALRAATLSPARFLGAADSLGMVAVGRRADLVLLDADPLADIRNTTTIAAVMVGGKLLERTELDALLKIAESVPGRP